MIAHITEEQALQAIKLKEFPSSITSSNNKAALVLTQSWCPQWIAMKGYLKKVDNEEKEIDIYIFEYDITGVFDQFMSFKEEIWGNYEVPYIRYYKDGKCINTSNFISRENFISMMD